MYFLLIPLLLIFSDAKGQYFLTGQDPASVRWHQIQTAHFKIVYPKEYAQQAAYYLDLLTLAGPYVNQPYTTITRQKRFPVVLHNRTTTSNAMVGIAPMRADFFEMPSQDMYPQPWQKQLVLHEYRHTVQMNALRQGMTKGLYYILGEQGIAAVMGLWLPFWFIEGDAVYAETINSSSGRGRQPSFIYPLAAQVLDKKIYKYDKAYFGSFRDFVPDHYTLGYHLVAKGIHDHGIDMWKQTIDLVARRPYYLIPFTTSVKKQTGDYKVRFYNRSLKSLRNEWWLIDEPDIDTAMKYLSPETRFFTNYLFPSEWEDGSIVAEKTGLDDINRFVLITPDGEEKRIFTPGFDFIESLTSGGGMICWNEKAYDPRWSLRDYSVIKVYDVQQKKVRKISRRSRYFAPAISPDGKTVVTVYVSQTMEYALHLIDVETGLLIGELDTDENLFFQTPHWSEDGRYIVSTVLGDKGKSLVKIDVESRAIDYLLPFSFREIKWPVMYGEWIVYTGTYEGKDALYAIHAGSKEVYQVFEPRFGANYSSFSKDGKKIYFSYYTADGERVAVIDFVPERLTLIQPENMHSNYLADRLSEYQVFNLDEVETPRTDHEENKYRKGGHLFNLHSWAPLAIDVDNYSISPGATLLSQNILSTSVATLGYAFDPNEQTHKVTLGYDYYGLYPVISLTADYGGRRTPYTLDDEVIELYWRETNLALTLRVPLQLTRDKWVRGIQPSAGINQKFLDMLGPDPDSIRFRETSITSPNYRFYAYNQYKTSPKDIYPLWGQSIDLVFRHTPFSEDVSNQLGMSGWLFFPGIVPHHGIRIYGGYQKTETGNYSFSNLVAIPRGYNNITFPEYFSIRSDYAFPIAYPDWNIPGFFYLKRIYSKVFYDIMKGSHAGESLDLSSTGLELYTDWNFLSVIANFNLGVRLTHRFYDEEQRVEFLFGVAADL